MDWSGFFRKNHLKLNILIPSKINRKNLDWIIANDVSKPDRGFEAENNAVTMISSLGEKIVLPLQEKRALAEQILTEILHRITL